MRVRVLPLKLCPQVVSDEAFTCVAWDSAGTTTSEVTVPIVLAIGLGIGKAINVQDTFGILSMASVFPIISVLVAGIGRRIKKGTFMEDVRQMYAAPFPHCIFVTSCAGTRKTNRRYPPSPTRHSKTTMVQPTPIFESAHIA